MIQDEVLRLTRSVIGDGEKHHESAVFYEGATEQTNCIKCSHLIELDFSKRYEVPHMVHRLELSFRLVIDVNISMWGCDCP